MIACLGLDCAVNCSRALPGSELAFGLAGNLHLIAYHLGVEGKGGLHAWILLLRLPHSHAHMPVLPYFASFCLALPLQALVGEGLAEFIKSGSREELFITSKVWQTEHRPADARWVGAVCVWGGGLDWECVSCTHACFILARVWWACFAGKGETGFAHSVPRLWLHP